MFGFTYNGIHSSKYGLYYTQSAEDKWFNDPEYDVYGEDVDWHHGGYYYGSKAKVRTFTIKCYFEEIDIIKRQGIKQWVARDTSGRLIFDDMPFVYWNVHPGKIPVGNWYLDTDESHSGSVTFTFIAYEPFGYLTRKYNTPGSPDDGAENYCNIISASEMPPAPTTSSTTFAIHNPGTEDCGLSIEISGSTSNPFRFFNNTNGTMCIFESLPSNNLHVSIDGDTGYVSLADGSNGFAYHDKGVLKISPTSGRDGIPFEYDGLNGTVHAFILSEYEVTSKCVGSTMTINGVTNTTFTITGVSAGSNKIYCTRDGSGTPPETGTCNIKQVNVISIEERVNNVWTTSHSTLALNSISVDYKPRLL